MPGRHGVTAVREARRRQRDAETAGDRRDGGRGGAAQEKTPHLERVVAINRVSKVVKGGRRFSFTALVVVGDGDGMVGVGYGKAKEVPAAIAKGVEEAKKNFFRVPRIAGTIPHPSRVRRPPVWCCCVRPAPVPVSSPVARCVPCWSAPASTTCCRKSLGSDNAINIVHATVAALKGLQRPEEVAARRGLPLEDVAPAGMLRARARRQGAGDHGTLKVTQVKSTIGTKQNHRSHAAHPRAAQDPPVGGARGQPRRSAA